ncbi:SRPBCC family protein [Paracoccus tegillarcae]|uniref:SRPBCC family protein n=1 Tax=Paracoccus tegillarcae TaxID=1529068 RepID=A0A2K9F219_9RHOB|nr:SRPBCC family protein [Paracoccus tegillarcae]AUH34412.1 hypothetical protein CUV01_14360 [Paracoccus tegillarcae]
MKFSTRKETELAAEDLYRSISDFDWFEHIVQRRGAAITRSDKSKPATGGRAWDIRFQWRGRRRMLHLVVTEIDRPERLIMKGESEAFDLTITMTVVALGRTRSRLIFEIDLRPRTMRARLMLQTAKLGKSQLDKQFDRGIETLLNQMTAERA